MRNIKNFSLAKFKLPSWKKFLNLGVLGFFTYYLSQNLHLVETLKNVDGLTILYLCLIQLLFIFIYSISIFLIFKTQHITIKEFFPLQCATHFFNIILPKGGTIFRAYYLKKNYKISYSAFSSSFLSTTISILLACTFLLMIALPYADSSHTISIVLTAVCAILLGTFLLKKIQPFLPPKLQQIAHAFLVSWHLFRKNKIILSCVTFLMVIMTILSGALFYLAFSGLGIASSSSVDMTLMATISQLTSLFSLTPNGLGPREALLALSRPEYISTDIIVIGSLLVHVTSYITNIIIGLPSYIYLTRFKKKEKPASID